MSFGGANNGNASISASTTWVLDANNYRRKVNFINTDAAISINLYKGGGAAIGKGIYLRPYGSYEDTMDARGYIYTGPYTAIGDAAGPSILSFCEE